MSYVSSANHKGWFEFRMCPNNDPTRRVTHECLDRHLLRLADGTTRLPVTSDMYDVTVSLRLPAGLTCSQCVLQWKYNTGNEQSSLLQPKFLELKSNTFNRCNAQVSIALFG